MPATINDLVTRGSNGSRPSPTTLTATKSIGAATITCAALTGWPTASAVHFVIYTVNTANQKVAGSQTDWKGVVSGSTITGLVLKAGTDNGYSIGAIVEASPTAAWADDNYAAMTQDHDSLGRHSKLTDTNGVKILGLTPTASAVNDVVVTNAITGAAPTIAAEGTDTNIDLKATGKGTGRAYTDGLPPRTFADESFADFTATGGVWTGDAYASTKNASMTAWTGYINGQRGSIAAVTARVFTASKDTYVDVLNTSGTFTLVYTEVANNAASPALAANSIRIAIITTGATNIAAATNVNQGQAAATTPVVSSVILNYGCDSLGNRVFLRTPISSVFFQPIIMTGTFSNPGSSGNTQVGSFTVPALPVATKLLVFASGGASQGTAAPSVDSFLRFRAGGLSGTVLAQSYFSKNSAAGIGDGKVHAITYMATLAANTSQLFTWTMDGNSALSWDFNQYVIMVVAG